MIFLLCIAIATLVVLPFVPAIVELRRLEDSEPIRISERYEEDHRFGPRVFMRAVNAALREMTNDVRSAAVEAFNIVDPTSLESLSAADCKLPHMIVGSGGSQLPDCTDVSHPIYSAEDIQIGAESVVDALVSEKNVHLAAGSEVRRWVRGGETVEIAESCCLSGSAEAYHVVRLHPGVTFERVHGPVVETVGPDCECDAPEADSNLTHLRLVSGGDACPRTVVHGEFLVEPGETHKGEVVAHGKITVASGARVVGNIRSRRSVIIGENAIVQGSVFSATTISMSAGSRVTGLVSSEKSITIEKGCVCGLRHNPTTVSAPNISVAPGVRVHGTLWATRSGVVAGPDRKAA